MNPSSEQNINTKKFTGFCKKMPHIRMPAKQEIINPGTDEEVKALINPNPDTDTDELQKWIKGETHMHIYGG